MWYVVLFVVFVSSQALEMKKLFSTKGFVKYIQVNSSCTGLVACTDQNMCYRYSNGTVESKRAWNVTSVLYSKKSEILVVSQVARNISNHTLSVAYDGQPFKLKPLRSNVQPLGIGLFETAPAIYNETYAVYNVGLQYIKFWATYRQRPEFNNVVFDVPTYVYLTRTTKHGNMHVIAGKDRQAYLLRNEDLRTHVVTFGRKYHRVRYVNSLDIRKDDDGFAVYATDDGVYVMYSWTHVKRTSLRGKAQYIVIDSQNRIYCTIDNVAISLDLKTNETDIIKKFENQNLFQPGTYFTGIALSTVDDLVWFTTRETAIYWLRDRGSHKVHKPLSLNNLQLIYQLSFVNATNSLYILGDTLYIHYVDNGTIALYQNLPPGNKVISTCESGQQAFVGAFNSVWSKW